MKSYFWILTRIIPIVFFTVGGYRFDEERIIVEGHPALYGAFAVCSILGARSVFRMLKKEEKKGNDKRSNLWNSPFFESRSTFFFTGGLCSAGFSASYLISPESSPVIFGFILSSSLMFLGGVASFRMSQPQPNQAGEAIGTTRSARSPDTSL